MTALSFPDVEAMVRQFLEMKVAPVKVHTKVPSTRSATFVRAWRTGGAATNRVLDQPLVTVQAWAPDSVAASKLAGDCREAILNEYTQMPLVRRVEEVTGPYFDPDPSTGIDRYSLTFQLSVRAAR